MHFRTVRRIYFIFDSRQQIRYYLTGKMSSALFKGVTAKTNSCENDLKTLHKIEN